MPETKIINVLKSDSFDDVFGLLKNINSDEVILILPKGSRFISKEKNLQALRDEASSTGKLVSFMTSDDKAIYLAQKYGFEVLESGTSERKPEGNQDHQEQETGDYFDLGSGDNPEPTVQLAAYTKKPVRPMKDVIPEQFDRKVKVKYGKDRELEVEIKKEQDKGDKQFKIGQIWANQRKIRNFKKPLGVSQKIVKRVPVLIALGAIIILGIIVISIPSSAKIIVMPKKQPVILNLKISASTKASKIDTDFNTIPGQLFSEQKEESGIFSASGQKNVAQKASGKITIYNKSLSPQRLVATTRFQTSEGLIYRIPQTVTVPTGTKSGGSILPGSVESIVYADKPGAEFNISATKFTIPGFRDTPKFNDFYGSSSFPMVGGIIGPAKIVTENDFSKAQEFLSAKLKNELSDSIKGQSGDLKILNSIAISIDQPITNARVLEAADNLEMTLKGSIKVIAFRESDVRQLIEGNISKSEDVKLLDSGLLFEYDDPIIDSLGSSMAFRVSVSGFTASKLDSSRIATDIAGMSEDAIKKYFSDMSEVDSAKITISPFWSKKISTDVSKIKVEITDN